MRSMLRPTEIVIALVGLALTVSAFFYGQREGFKSGYVRGTDTGDSWPRFVGDGAMGNEQFALSNILIGAAKRPDAGSVVRLSIGGGEPTDLTAFGARSLSGALWLLADEVEGRKVHRARVTLYRPREDGGTSKVFMDHEQ
jgi:hypothetical protein